MTSQADAPPDSVLAAFGVRDDPLPLDGGKGGTWRAGGVILKPVEFPAETLWRAEVLHGLAESPDFRIARPLRTITGHWIHDGWEAGRFVEGEPDVTRTDDEVRAGIAFHAAISHLPRPAFLDHRTDPWSHGDRVAWQESSHQPSPPAARLLAPLIAARRPITLTPQLIHGDLPGNVLFAPGQPPAIIDWPPYWRPAPWAAAIAVADALCWYDADPVLLTRWAHLPEWPQLLLRALIYRVVTHDQACTSWTPDHLAAYEPVIPLVT
ncbi:uncharacterized protein (TIGR02569 family) [Actinokineospora baliensis]|uniref:TIGR02569 family protein n=1 Tax=Actinokineospora baliensis TaxID=547056 RepID=UPI0027DC72CF|nr:TIGR02569 family protein [Actinokineospora baliensis]MBM7774761.1 uncharacterized protein (TIGR02569 family) [Actinokineospora baliensis]